MNYDAYNFVRKATVEQLADIALKMISEHPDTFLRLLNSQADKTFKVPSPQLCAVATLTTKEIQELREIPIGNKIMRIKKLREFTRLSLKEAKDVVESQEFIDVTGDQIGKRIIPDTY